MLKNGSFEKGSHSWVSEELIEQHPDIYVGYSFNWEGMGNPMLRSMELLRENGLVFENDNALEVEIFVADKGNETGVVNSQDAQRDGLLEQYKNVQGFKVKDEFTLILHVRFLEVVPDDIAGLRINFTNFGIKRTETIPFDGLVKNETEE